MHLSLNWLKQYVNLPKGLSAKKLAHNLTMSTVEVESVENQLDDVIIELDNKSMTHRPDLWNHYGIARELSVIYKTSLHNVILNEAERSEGSRGKKENNLSIKILDKKLCPRYIGCVVRNIKIRPSPIWLQKSLEVVGLHSINNIVDITNYAMLDLGEPMHAFDLAKLGQTAELRGNVSGTTPTIIIRTAKKGEKIKTLDEIERKLDESMLVIADEKKPIALAGIMGGLDSAVDENTTEIILEAANFDAINIRKTTQKLGVRTEASNRFEKNLDPEFAWLGMQKALALIKEILPEAEIGEIVDVNYAKHTDLKIKLTHEFIEKRIGQKIAKEKVKDILEGLEFEVKNSKFIYEITVPSWRATGDIDCPEDIVEEVARIYGYNNLADQPIHLSLTKPVYQKDQELVVKTKEFLALNAGLNEIFNYPWASEIYLKKLGQNDKMIEVANPPSDDNKWLQTSLIPNLIKNVEDNLRYLDEFGIFELSRVYNVDKTEPKMLSGALVVDKNYDAFFETKGIIENLFGNLRITDYALSPYGGSPAGRQITKFLGNYLNNEKCLAVLVGEKQIGWLGELKKDIYSQFNFKNRNICLWEINFDKLVDAAKKMPAVKYIPLPQFPAVVRDLAFELDWKVRWADIFFVILNLIQDPVINEIEFLSEFDLGPKKSVAFRITYQADRTLKDEEVKIWQNKIIKLITEKFKAKLRK